VDRKVASRKGERQRAKIACRSLPLADVPWEKILVGKSATLTRGEKKKGGTKGISEFMSLSTKKRRKHTSLGGAGGRVPSGGATQSFGVPTSGSLGRLGLGLRGKEVGSLRCMIGKKLPERT